MNCKNEINDSSLTQDDELCDLGIQNGDVCGVSNDDLEDPDPVFSAGCDPTAVGGDDCDDVLDTEEPLDPGVLPCGEFDPSDEEDPGEPDVGSIPPVTPPPCDECLDNPNDPSKCEEPEEAGTLSDLDDCKNVMGTDTFSDCDDDTVATVDSNQTIPGLDDTPEEPDVDPVTPDIDPEIDPEECIPELDPNNWDCSGNPKPVLPLDPDCTPGLLVDNWDCRGNPREKDDVIPPVVGITVGGTLDPEKRDTDKDKIPDVDDPDDDNDDILDGDDPNPLVYTILDNDGDDIPDRDDPDKDNDGVLDGDDPNPYDWNPSLDPVYVVRPDNDDDSIPDDVDPDDDNDGIPDLDDSEPFIFNKTEDLPDDHPYADPDNDGILNKNDPDDDNDDILDGDDPNPLVYTDLDNDGDDIPDRDDPDDDDDGIPDLDDPEPFIFTDVKDLPVGHPYAVDPVNPFGYTYGETRFEFEFLRVLNIERARFGVKPLELDPNLTQAACVVSAFHNKVDWHNLGSTNPHVGEGGTDVQERVRQVGGFRGSTEHPLVYENMQQNPKVTFPDFTDAKAAEFALSAWLTDQMHQINIIGEDLTHVGICLNGTMFTMVSGQPDGTPILEHIKDGPLAVPSQVRSSRKRSVDEILVSS